MAVVANVFRVASARPQPPRAHRAGRRRAVVHRLHRDVGAVGVGRGRVARDLAIDAGITKGTLTGVVGTLERRGLVARRRAAADGRLVRVGATPAGDELMAGLFARFNEGEARIVSGLDAGESRAAGAAAPRRAALGGGGRSPWQAIRGTVSSSAPGSSPTCRRWCCPRRSTRAQRRAGEISLVPGLHRMKSEQLDPLAIDTIIVFDAHSATTVEFVVVGAGPVVTASTRPTSCRRDVRRCPTTSPAIPSWRG